MSKLDQPPNCCNSCKLVPFCTCQLAQVCRKKSKSLDFLRHTWASWHVQNGTSLQELQQLGGWSSFDMVLRYAHLSSEHLRCAAERVQRKIFINQNKGMNYCGAV